MSADTGDDIYSYPHRRAFRARLLREEGWRNRPYMDHLGFWTVGVGRFMAYPLSTEELALCPKNCLEEGGTILMNESVIISDDLIGLMLHNDMSNTLRGARLLFDEFDGFPQQIQLVILDMMFQLGLPRFMKFKKMIRAICLKRWHRMAGEMMASKYARKDTPARAKRNMDLIEEVIV